MCVVEVSKLCGSVFTDYELVFDVPNGAVLVAWDEEDAAQLRLVVKPGVMFVTRAQARRSTQAGVAYTLTLGRVAPREAEEASVEEDDVYEVVRVGGVVVDARNNGRRMEYLIKWKDYRRDREHV